MIDIGAVFPQELVGRDASAARDFAQAVEGAGYGHLALVDHVLGAPRGSQGPRQGSYTHESVIHEPLVLAVFLAAATSRLNFITSILILPQRQTALVAKQAAEVDVLSGGRLILGVAVGYQRWEFEGLNQEYASRASRIVEQVDVLRRLWAAPTVAFASTYHTIADAGINPRPAAGTIPIWMGGGGDRSPDGTPSRNVDRILTRIGSVADGWVIVARSLDDFADRRTRVREAAAAAGRDPDLLQMHQYGAALDGRSLEEQALYYKQWEAAGVTHISMLVRDPGSQSLAAQLELLTRYREVYAKS